MGPFFGLRFTDVTRSGTVRSSGTNGLNTELLCVIA